MHSFTDQSKSALHCLERLKKGFGSKSAQHGQGLTGRSFTQWQLKQLTITAAKRIPCDMHQRSPQTNDHATENND